MLKPSNLSKMLSKHSSNCTQIVFLSAHNIFNIWEALRQANYVSTSEFNVFALCKFTWNNVYISASEDSKDVQHVAKLPGMSEAFFWSLVQQGVSMRCTTTNLGSSPPVQLVFSAEPLGRRSTPAASSESDCCPRLCLHPDRLPPGAKHIYTSVTTEMVLVLMLGCFSVLFTSRVI